MWDTIKNLKTLTRCLNNLSLNLTCNNQIIQLNNSNRPIRTLSLSSVKCDLMEFFDDVKNWGANEVKSGRIWKKDELRLKSNRDLHKLWYVLIKERNMLLTMENEAKEQIKLFPSPERLDKVEESMENLEKVVRERNKAYHLLETGEAGERPGKMKIGPFGLRYYYKMSQYPIPEFMNKKHHAKYQDYYPTKDTEAFLSKYREKLYLSKKKQQKRDLNHVIGLMNRFPNMDMEAVKQQYPSVDIEKAKRSRKYRAHFVPK